MRGIAEKTLGKLAESIGCNDNTVTKLGLELNLPYISIEVYHKKNQGSTAGTLAMLIEWKRDISPWEQVKKLRTALIGARLTELAEIFFPSDNVSRLSLDSVDSGVFSDDAEKMSDENDRTSTVLRCRTCDRLVGNICDVINCKISGNALSFRIDTIFGVVCLVQLRQAYWVDTRKAAGRYDTITLSAADLRESSKANSSSTRYHGFPNEYGMQCKGCSEQIGWCYKPRVGSNLPPFYVLWLQAIITETYIKDVTSENVINEITKKMSKLQNK